MSFPFFDDTHETPKPTLRVVEPEPRRTPQYRITTRGWVVLWAIWVVIAYHLSPIVEFWWTKF